MAAAGEGTLDLMRLLVVLAAVVEHAILVETQTERLEHLDKAMREETLHFTMEAHRRPVAVAVAQLLLVATGHLERVVTVVMALLPVLLAHL
jgi:hypothetical protein